MKKQRILSLCLASLLALSLAACNGQTDEQDSTPPTVSVQPTTEPTPTPTPPIPYTDVAEGAPYYDAVVWAYKNGIASDGDTFEPDSACTRGQVMTFLWRANGSPEPQATESPFSDVSSADWFYKPAVWAYENGIATSTTFNPGNPCTCGEAVTFLYRAEGKPAAAVYSSPMALAAPDKYFTRPMAWAETNGLFTGADFDPAAPCSRAVLMTYLYWVTEEWTFTEEDKTVQAEYEQIINDAQLFEVHGSGLLYADYVDVDGDGKVELLTVDSGENLSVVAGWPSYNVTATIYANIDGHAGKYCEQTFDCTSSEGFISLCAYDGQMYFCYETLIHGAGPEDVFYTVENGAFVISDQIAMERDNYFVNDDRVSEAEYNTVLGKYANHNKLFGYSSYGLSAQNRGLVPDPSAVMQEIYAAVKAGDFSAFAKTYKNRFGDSLTLDNQGILTGGGTRYATNQKPISIEVTKAGVIRCEIIPVGWIEQEGPILAGGGGVCVGDSYYIYPIGIEIGEYITYDEYGYEYEEYIPWNPGSGMVRIVYLHWGGSAGLSIDSSDIYY